MQILLQLEIANVNSTDHRGQSALMRAIIAKQRKTALFLLSRTSPKRLLKTNRAQQTVFHLVSMVGAEDILANLLSQLRRQQTGQGKLDLSGVGVPDTSEKENRRGALNVVHSSSLAVGGDKTGPAARETSINSLFDASGHTPLEYALMFGHGAVALRMAYHADDGIQPSVLAVEPKFLANCVVMSPSTRALAYGFFNIDEVVELAGFGPSATTGTQRLSWPDVRCLGLTHLQQDKWAAQRLHDMHTIEYEKRRYKALVQHLELKFKLKLNYDGIEERGSSSFGCL